MTRTTLSLLCLTSVFAQITLADDYTVIEKPFKKVTTLSGTFFPKESTPISVAPKVWTDFSITSLVSQGAVVKKGDALIGIDTQKIDEHIAKSEKARKLDLLKLAQAQHELAQLEISTPRNLEKYARTEKEAADYLKWFTEIGMPRDIEAAKHKVKSSEQMLAYQKEELKQLEKMYSEDNKTEETEEIILIRTRNYIEKAEFTLKSTKIETAYTLDTELPRQLASHQRSAKHSSIANKAAQESLKRALEIKRLEVAKAEKDDTEKADHLAKLKADREMMNITAPADGIVYYGSIKDGQWNPSGAVKTLKIGGKVPAHLTLFTLIPTEPTLALSASMSEGQLATLKKGAKGLATTQLQAYTSLPVTIQQINKYPQTDGKYYVEITQDTQNNQGVVTGMKASMRFVSNQMEKALVVPISHLTKSDDGGHTVKLKLADGQTEDRNVEISTANKKHAVIVKGLEAGQVIVK